MERRTASGRRIKAICAAMGATLALGSFAETGATEAEPPTSAAADVALSIPRLAQEGDGQIYNTIRADGTAGDPTAVVQPNPGVMTDDGQDNISISRSGRRGIGKMAIAAVLGLIGLAKKGSSMFKRRKSKNETHDEGMVAPAVLAYDDSGNPVAAETVDLTDAPPPPVMASDARSAAEGDFDASINQSAPADLRMSGTNAEAQLQAPPQAAMASVPQGWFDDPMNSHMVRWWDGSTWTGHVRSRPAAA